MNLKSITRERLETAAKNSRHPDFLKSIGPAIIDNADGLFVDMDHPAFRQAFDLKPLPRAGVRTGISGAQQSRGLGDTIKKLTSMVGIKQCGGCKKRQEALNKLIPYKSAERSTS